MLPPQTMILRSPLILFDDAREGGAQARLYDDPVRMIVAHAVSEVMPALDAVRAGLAEGLHAAGFLGYGAAAAFEPRVPAAALPAASTAPLAWFGLFTGYRTIADVAAVLPDPAGAWIGAPVPEVSRDQYDAMLARVLALIEAGDIYQANLTFRATVRVLGDPAALYARLRATSAAGWGAYLDTGGETLLSLSPEVFFALAGGALVCRPMKGTARRDDDPRADAEAAAALSRDAKQRAENLMIVDLMRNDFSRVAVPGSVAVPTLFAVEAYPTVHQMTSTVTARLEPDRDAIDVLAALFPCGSITGAPKVRAMQVIGDVEQGRPRGPYTGAIGWIEPGGDAQFNVAIRTLLLRPGATHAVMGLGGGIVADSRAESEWDEALAKGAFVARATPRFELVETMAFKPGEGIALLDRHLARMRMSAETFGYPFDLHAVRNALQVATFRLRRATRVRLLLAASGAIAIETAPAPAPRETPLRVAIVPLPVAASDYRLRHKTTDRGFYDIARRASGVDEVAFVDADGFLTEGSFTSIFVPRDGRLLTPPLAHGLLPGVLRADLIATARAIERDLDAEDLAEGFFVGNALRGLMPAIVAVAKAGPADV